MLKPPSKSTPIKPELPWKVANLRAAVDLLLKGADPKVLETQKPTDVRRKAENKIKAIAKVYLDHTDAARNEGTAGLAGAPRPSEVLKRLKALNEAAFALAECMKTLDPSTLSVLHEPIGPTGVIGKLECGMRFPSPSDVDPKEARVAGWERGLRELATCASKAAESMKGQDPGGDINMVTLSTGRAIPHLIQQCDELLQAYGHRVVVDESGILGEFIQAVFSYAAGNTRLVLADYLKFYSKKRSELKGLDIGIKAEMNKFQGIDLKALLLAESLGVEAIIPEPPSSEFSHEIMKLSQRRSRLQSGMQDARVRKGRSKRKP